MPRWREPASVSRAEAEGAVRRARVLSLALMGGVVVFAGVAAFLVAGRGFGGEGVPVAGYLPAAFVLGAAACAGGPALARRLSMTAPAERPADRWVTEVVVRQSVREGVGLAGIALSLVAGSAGWVLAFAALSVGSQLVGWPGGEELERRLRGS